jgi:hypothetical protein
VDSYDNMVVRSEAVVLCEMLHHHVKTDKNHKH